jgi:putative endonuclease
MFIVYAISSINHNYYIYVGLTSNLEERLKLHNRGGGKTTKLHTPFKLIYFEEVETRIQARKREKYWKSVIGKEKLRLIRDKD